MIEYSIPCWATVSIPPSDDVGVDEGKGFWFCLSGADLLKLTREDVIQICGPADGIRLFNALKGR